MRQMFSSLILSNPFMQNACKANPSGTPILQMRKLRKLRPRDVRGLVQICLAPPHIPRAPAFLAVPCAFISAPALCDSHMHVGGSQKTHMHRCSQGVLGLCPSSAPLVSPPPAPASLASLPQYLRSPPSSSAAKNKDDVIAFI